MDIASYVYTVSFPLAGMHRYLSLNWTYQSHHLPSQGMIRKRKRKKVPAHWWDTAFNRLSSIFPLENCSLGYISHPFVGPACTHLRTVDLHPDFTSFWHVPTALFQACLENFVAGRCNSKNHRRWRWVVVLLFPKIGDSWEVEFCAKHMW